TLQAPAGLSSVADAVWTGNHLKMVRFAVENKTLSALNIRESDFWQPGTRAVMFSQPASQLPQMPASPPGPEGEPQPGNTPVSFPPQGSVAVPPPTAFYPGNG
ncbi:hypothetical protein ACRW5H_24805, partial [Escherichia coli]